MAHKILSNKKCIYCKQYTIYLRGVYKSKIGIRRRLSCLNCNKREGKEITFTEGKKYTHPLRARCKHCNGIMVRGGFVSSKIRRPRGKCKVCKKSSVIRDGIFLRRKYNDKILEEIIKLSRTIDINSSKYDNRELKTFSTRNIEKEIMKKYNIKVSNKTIADFLKRINNSIKYTREKEYYQY